MSNRESIYIYIYIYLWVIANKSIKLYIYIYNYRSRSIWTNHTLLQLHFVRDPSRGAKTRHMGRPQVITVRLQNAAARAVEPKSRAKRLFILASWASWNPWGMVEHPEKLGLYLHLTWYICTIQVLQVCLRTEHLYIPGSSHFCPDISGRL